MAPKFAPKVWKRPYTSIYNDNYRYGNSLYSDAVDEIERKYNEALANTRFRRDRPDLGLSSFADSQLTGESVARNLKTKSANDSLNNELVRSLSTERVNSYLEANERRAHTLASSPSFDSYYSQRQMDRLNADLEESRLRRSTSSRARSMGRTRPESAYFTRQTSYELANGDASSPAPRDSFWMERWYRNSLRSVRGQFDLYPPSLFKALTLV